MKEGWKYVNFKDIYPVKMGKTPPRKEAASWDPEKKTKNKWVSIADISKNEGRYITDTNEYIADSAASKIFKVPRGSLLMSFKLSIGRMAFAGDDLYTNEAIIAIPDNGKYNIKFLYYYLLVYNWRSLTEGAEKVKGATLNKESIGRIKLPVVNTKEQQKIVDFLDKKFAAIDKMAEVAEKETQAAKDLFQSALKEAMTPRDGWQEKKLGEVGTFQRGGNFLKSDFVEHGVPCIHYGQIHMKFGTRTDTNLTFISEEKAHKARYAQHGDLVIAITSEDVECSCKSTAWMGDFHVAVGAHAAIFHHTLDPIFVSYYFQSPEFQRQKISFTHGFKVIEIKPSDIATISITFPTYTEQQAIATKLDTLAAKCKQIEENSKKTLELCTDLKQALLRQIFE